MGILKEIYWTRNRRIWIICEKLEKRNFFGMAGSMIRNLDEKTIGVSSSFGYLYHNSFNAGVVQSGV
jgi:hypothetical protein